MKDISRQYLKKKEAQILHAKDKAIQLEYELFKDIRTKVETYTHDLQELSTQIAMIDVFK